MCPGDLIQIPYEFEIPCDCILIEGHVVMNESSLTGEVNAVVKTPLPDNENVFYSSVEHKKHTIYSGTKSIQTNSNLQVMPIALVT